MKKTFCFLALFAAGAACEKNPGAPEPPSGSLGVEYTGYRTGRLDTEGAPNQGVATDYAAAFDVVDDENAAGHLGGEQYADSTGQSIVITLNALTAGEYQLSSSCDWKTARCGYGLFEYDPNIGDATPAEPYEIMGGSIVIAEDSGGRLKGTFTAEAQMFNRATGNLILGRTLSLTNGRFDVPLLDLTPG